MNRHPLSLIAILITIFTFGCTKPDVTPPIDEDSKEFFDDFLVIELKVNRQIDTNKEYFSIGLEGTSGSIEDAHNSDFAVNGENVGDEFLIKASNFINQQITATSLEKIFALRIFCVGNSLIAEMDLHVKVFGRESKIVFINQDYNFKSGDNYFAELIQVTK